MEPQIETARVVAMAAHGAVGQIRRYTGEPYWKHPEMVAKLVSQRTHGNRPVLVAVAWLHDVLEDTQLTAAFIREVFGPVVAKHVIELTDVRVSDKKSQNALTNIARLTLVSEDAMLVKLCDIEANTSCITSEYNDHFLLAWLPTEMAIVYAIGRVSRTLQPYCNEIIDSVMKIIREQHPELLVADFHIEAVDRLNKAWKLRVEMMKEQNHG